MPATGSFEELYANHGRRVLAAIVLAGVEPTEAEDVTQEAFARTLVHWKRVSTGSNPDGYVYRVAFRIAHRRVRSIPFVNRPDTDWPESRTVDAIAVRSALRHLPRRQRECVVMGFYLGMSAEETARILRIQASTVRTHLQLAKEELSKTLN